MGGEGFGVFEKERVIEKWKDGTVLNEIVLGTNDT